MAHEDDIQADELAELWRSDSKEAKAAFRGAIQGLLRQGRFSTDFRDRISHVLTDHEVFEFVAARHAVA